MRDRQFKRKGRENLTNDKILEKWRRYYYNHQDYHISRNRKYYADRMFKWYEWLVNEGYGVCKTCGFNEHPKAIDFHHINPEEKVFGIGKFINGRQCNEENKKIVLEELNKCVTLCANCHRIFHHTNRGE